MAQPNPGKKEKLDQVLKLVEELSPDQLTELRRQLDLKTWGTQWDELANRVRVRNENPISDDEIAENFTALRREQKGKGCSE